MNPYHFETSEREPESRWGNSFEVVLVLMALLIIVPWSPICSLLPRRNVSVLLHLLEACCWAVVYFSMAFTFWVMFL